MVFCCRCWSIQDEMQYKTSDQENTLRVFTLAELKYATKNFKPSFMMGGGGFGSVHMGVVKSLKHPFNDIRVVVKQFKRGQMGKRQWEAEVKYLGNIKHQNLVKLIGYSNEDSGNENNLFLVYEYLHNRSSDGHLSSLPWDMRLKIAKDAATGLACLHEELGREIIFKDFKPSNVLLDNELNAKLSYFGFVREAPPRTHVETTVVGTREYVAPEYIQTGRLTTKMDVWSYGIFLQELITGGFSLAQENSENNPECKRWVCCCYAGGGKSKLMVDPRLEVKYYEKSMQKVVSIAKKCLIVEPKRRPKMSEVVKLVKEAIDLEQLPNAAQT